MLQNRVLPFNKDEVNCLLVTLSQLHFAFSSSNPTGLSLRAVLDDSPESPLYHIENLTSAERGGSDNIRIGIFRDGLFYVVGFTIGSQRHPVKLLMDSGGGLIWTQCQPCKNCFPRNLGIYDPRVSRGYGILPCDHPFCDGDGRIYNCVNGVCVYDVRYGGGASTRGVASLEAFHFLIDRSNIKTFNNVIFGCSDDNRDIFFKNTDISGIFGLSMARDSMASQFSPLIHARFSYCLVPFIDAIPRPLVLRFGEDIPQLPPQHVQTTMFLPKPGSNYYDLDLLDISVANHRLGFHPYTFRTRPNGLGGCFIDSGALFSVIDSDTIGVNAYQAVVTVFEAYCGSGGLRRTTADPNFGVCYEYPTNYHDFASITFHFNGADYTVDGQYGHYFGRGYFCVAIITGNFGTVLGAWHQQNKRIIYDAGIGGLQFADEQCINDVL
ncbi:aspartic proteinase nepenthesin-1-like [Durio zibethinus]|uniref:Aspartic proteinase nepenthesin-1-like n=1 Tax=Durio zibethinus TaxID=66656 RepID=A0A6P5WPM8_DURZI|nr:aspartic proteinase nepenthesin-1-like [Durio zibethinus]